MASRDIETIARLGAPDGTDDTQLRDVAERAAGNPFLDLDDVTALSGLAEDDAGRLLDRSLEQGILEVSMAGYRFRHDLVRQALVDAMPPHRRADVHRIVRHPLMLGFVIAFWAAPTMTVRHLLFAAVTTAYILVALQCEERNLVHHFGDRYREYRERTPMLLPWPKP